MQEHTPSQEQKDTEMEYTVTQIDVGDLEGVKEQPSLPEIAQVVSLATSSPQAQVSPATKETIVAFAEQYSVTLASKRFKVPATTIKRWMKAENVPMKPKFNSPGRNSLSQPCHSYYYSYVLHSHAVHCMYP